MQASIYITVDTVEVFEKRRKNHSGGCGDRNCIEFEAGSAEFRVKIRCIAKVRGWKAAKKTMLNAIEKDLNERFADVKEDIILGMAYTCSKEEAMEWKQEIMNRFPGYEFLEAPLSLSVSCHIGPGANGGDMYQKSVEIMFHKKIK